MYLLVIPMILLLTYIVIASSEAVLDEANSYSSLERRDLAFTLRKKYHETSPAQVTGGHNVPHPVPEVLEEEVLGEQG